MVQYSFEHKRTIEQLKAYYQTINKVPGLVASEVTFTFAPSRCSDIQDTKKRCLNIIKHRLTYCKYLVGAIIVRENHESGWPHAHGIVWFPEDHNNAATLGDGRLWVPRKSKSEPAHWVCEELGQVRMIKPLRQEPYKQYDKDGSPAWENWLDYILKDQHVKWADPNLIVRGHYDIDNYFSKPKTDIID